MVELYSSFTSAVHGNAPSWSKAALHTLTQGPSPSDLQPHRPLRIVSVQKVWEKMEKRICCKRVGKYPQLGSRISAATERR